MLVLMWAGCGAPQDVCGPAPVAHDWRSGTDLMWASDDEQTCVRVERTADELPDDWACKACPFTLHRMVVVHDDVVVDERNADALTYTPSHHNWADEAAVSVDDVTYVVRFGPDDISGLADVLEVQRGDDVVDEVPLTPVSMVDDL